MPRTLRRKDQVADLVLSYLRRKFDDPGICQVTRVATLGMDNTYKDRVHRRIARMINERGGSARGATPTKFRRAEKVSDIIDMFWKAVRDNA